jgi:FkbM family methyltransferase
MSLKSVLRSLVESSGFSVVRAGDVYNPFEVLPLIVNARVASQPGFFFVQVGANDGVKYDPLRQLILDHRLSGILVEPLPDVFAELKANYAGIPGLIFENVAIAPATGRMTVYRVPKSLSAAAGRNLTALSSFNRQHLRDEGVPDQHIESVSVEAVTMAELLARHQVTQVSLLQIDTEGFDDHVIESAFAAGLRPEIINYEHCHLGHRRKIACKQLLRSRGYQFIEVGWRDTLAVRSDSIGNRETSTG